MIMLREIKFCVMYSQFSMSFVVSILCRMPKACDPSSTRVLQMDRKKAREECVGTFNLISSDNELESKVCHGRDLPPNPGLFASLDRVRISVSYLVSF